MPLVTGNYHPSTIFRNADASTIYAAKFRKVAFQGYSRERIDLSDGDFLDLDWSFSVKKTDRIIILLHGLAGSSDRPYMKGMAKLFNENGWDSIAMNFRGCSEELNRLFKSYHAGASDDLAEVVTHVLSLKKYKKIALIGFSLGANLMLKYLGENRSIPQQIIAAMAISVPCDLEASLGAIDRMRNFIYSKRFELNLKSHLFARAKKFPNHIEKSKISACRSLRDIDDLYTSKAHGYTDASDYYKNASSLQFLQNIKIPTLILNARNDTFLSPECYPLKLAKNSDSLYLEIPAYGGHVGFVDKDSKYYHEKRALEFITDRL